MNLGFNTQDSFAYLLYFSIKEKNSHVHERMAVESWLQVVLEQRRRSVVLGFGYVSQPLRSVPFTQHVLKVKLVKI